MQRCLGIFLGLPVKATHVSVCGTWCESALCLNICALHSCIDMISQQVRDDMECGLAEVSMAPSEGGRVWRVPSSESAKVRHPSSVHPLLLWQVPRQIRPDASKSENFSLLVTPINRSVQVHHLEAINMSAHCHVPMSPVSLYSCSLFMSMCQPKKLALTCLIQP